MKPSHARSVRYLATLLAALGAMGDALGQGCIAARGTGACARPGHESSGKEEAGSGFQAAVNYRYFRADRPFSGDQESTGKNATKAVNNSTFIDFGLTYNFNPRTSIALTIPYSEHSRSVGEFLRGALRRYTMNAGGLGDVRLGGNVWLVNPADAGKGNVFLGLSVAAPTGEKDAKDGKPVVVGPPARPRISIEQRNVDQSIQPGTGAWGVAPEFFAYRQLTGRAMLFANGSYTITPEEDAGVVNAVTGSTPATFDTVLSTGDSYLARAGLSYTLLPKLGLGLSLAGRIEGAPARDLTGGNGGFRRPGYAVSIEPGVSIMSHGWSASISVPVAVHRVRELSEPERQAGMAKAGDASFADWSLLASVGRHF